MTSILVTALRQWRDTYRDRKAVQNTSKNTSP